jgi:GT2 family glycosyltransferase
MTELMLSVIVLGFKNFDKTTRLCVESLNANPKNSAIEFLLVDNGSPDDSAGKSQQWCDGHPDFRCLLSPDNLGFAGGMNWGVKHARGKWILLVNNDTLFPANTLEALLQLLNGAPEKIAMLAPVTNAAGNGQRLWAPHFSHSDWLECGHWLNANPTRELIPTYRSDFFCIAIRRDIWNGLGGLDTEFGLGYYEDVDFSLRLKNAGYQQMITEDVFVLHSGSATFKSNPDTKKLIKRNKKLLLSKHPNAQLEHTRLGNLAILECYLTIQADGNWSPALERRWQLRFDALKGDAPRSVIKKWLWKKKISKSFNI